jgi:hypothetical protein
MILSHGRIQLCLKECKFNKAHNVWGTFHGVAEFSYKMGRRIRPIL